MIPSVNSEKWLNWEKIDQYGDLYSPRTGHAVISLNRNIYLFGGIDEADRQNDMFQYSIVDNTWQKLKVLGEAPSPRSGSVVCVYNQFLYFFGGYTRKHGEYFNDLYRFNPNNVTWNKLILKNPPLARIDHSFCKIPSSNFSQAMVCILFGGSNGVKKLNDMHELHIDKGEWKQMNNDGMNPSGRFGHTAVVDNDMMYLFGGWDGTNTLNDLWCYNVFLKKQKQVQCYQYETTRWQLLEAQNSPASRYRHSALVHNKCIYIFGGVDQHQERFGDLHEYSIQTNSWRRIVLSKEGPTPRSFHKCVYDQSFMYVVGGYDGQRKNDMYKINLDLVQIQGDSENLKKVSQVISSEKKSDIVLLTLVNQEQSMIEQELLIKSLQGQNNNNNNNSSNNNQNNLIYNNGNGSKHSQQQQQQTLFNFKKKHGVSIKSIWQQFPTQRWFFMQQNVQNLYTPRTGHAAVCMDNIIYIFGGIDTDGNRNNDLYTLDLHTFVWKKIQAEGFQNINVLICICSGVIPAQRSGAKAICMKDVSPNNSPKSQGTNNDKGEIVIFGGYINKDTQHCNDLLSYDIGLNQWKQLRRYIILIINIQLFYKSQYPAKRTDHSMVKYGKFIYIFGGRGENKQIYKDLKRFNYVKKIWKDIKGEGAQIVPRFGHVAVSYEHSMYVFGGWDGQNCLDDLYQYSYVTNIWYEIRRYVGEKPSPRYRHDALVQEDNMCIFGGVDQNQTRFNDLYQFNFQKREWKHILTAGCLPSPRTFHKIVNQDNLIFLLGGFDGERRNDLHMINIKQDSDYLHKSTQKENNLSLSVISDDKTVIEPMSDTELVIKMLNEQVKELSKKIQREEERNLCKICFSREIDTVIMECCHFILCFNCTSNLKICPICRSHITKVIRTYLY